MPTAPRVVAANRARVQVVTADGGFRLAIVIDPEEDDSPLWFGAGSLRPGTELVSWDADPGTYEGYYVTAGCVRIAWSGPDSGESVVGPGDSFYFAPGRTYTLENHGDDEAFFVWAVTPPPPAAST